MNCQQVLGHLAELLYGDVKPEIRGELEKHITGCSACSREYRALDNVRRLLDLPKAPPARVTLPGMYRLLEQCQAQQARRWRRAAAALAGVAALLAVAALGLRFEARMEGGQLVLRWGIPSGDPQAIEPNAQIKLPDSAPEPVSAQATEEQLHTISKILHVLADDLRELERLQQRNVADASVRLREIQEQNLRRFAVLEKNIEALYTMSQKGE